MGRLLGGEHAGRAGRAFLILALTGCMLTVALLAASTSSTSVFTDAGGQGTGAPQPSMTSTPPPSPSSGLLNVRTDATGSGLAVFGIVGVVIMVLLATLVITILVLVVRMALAALRRRDPSNAHVSQRDDAVADGWTRTDAVTQALADLQRAVVEGSPRAGIIAAWVRLERLAGDSGVPPRPSETPAELTIRMLDGLNVPGRYVLRLADLYREARFSAHPMTEDDRAEAADCLRAVCGVPLNPPADQLTP